MSVIGSQYQLPRLQPLVQIKMSLWAKETVFRMQKDWHIFPIIDPPTKNWAPCLTDPCQIYGWWSHFTKLWSLIFYHQVEILRSNNLRAQNISEPTEWIAGLEMQAFGGLFWLLKWSDRSLWSGHISWWSSQPLVAPHSGKSQITDLESLTSQITDRELT